MCLPLRCGHLPITRDRQRSAAGCPEAPLLQMSWIYFILRQMPKVAAAGGVEQVGHTSGHPNTCYGASAERSEGCTGGTGDGRCSAGQARAFVPSSPALLSHVDGAEVTFGVPHVVPVAGRGGAEEG